jgi:hypothetical protein
LRLSGHSNSLIEHSLVGRFDAGDHFAGGGVMLVDRWPGSGNGLAANKRSAKFH